MRRRAAAVCLTEFAFRGFGLSLSLYMGRILLACAPMAIVARALAQSVHCWSSVDAGLPVDAAVNLTDVGPLRLLDQDGQTSSECSSASALKPACQMYTLGSLVAS